jgi:hypothetical protein
MSYQTINYLFCDGKELSCAAAFDHAPLPFETVTEQRERAKVEGWKHRKGKDYCPDCIKDMEAKG